MPVLFKNNKLNSYGEEDTTTAKINLKVFFKAKYKVLFSILKKYGP